MSETYTEKLICKYKEACEKNIGQLEYYHCATSNNITMRILDLNSPYVFCEKGSELVKNNNILEYKLQAYIIKEALKNKDYLLPIDGKKWKLIDAERTFVETDLKDNNGRLDILAYEESTQNYIVLELKIKRNLTGAATQLFNYTETIKKHIDAANKCYLANANDVKGYILWPCTEKPRDHEISWGLIEYDKKYLGDIENVKFKILQEPKENAGG